MSILIPGTTHQVRWTKQNLLDSATYYPRAVIRDTRTDEVLDTLELEEVASGRFSSPWPVAGDPSGQGREVEVEITIYEDSGYSQVSGIYGRWTEEYLIYDIRTAGRGGGSGGSAALTYKETKELFESVLSEFRKTIPEYEKADIDSVLRALKGLRESIEERTESIPESLEKLLSMASAIAQVLEATESIKAVVREAQEGISTSVEGAGEKVAEKASRVVTQTARDVRKDSETLLEHKVAAEVGRIIETFREAMGASTQDFMTKIQEGLASLAEQWSKPLTVSAVASPSVPGEKKSVADSRVERLVSLSSASEQEE